MANAVYPPYKQNLLAGTAGYDLDNNTADDGPYVVLLAAGYTYSAAHDFYSDVSASVNGVGTDQRITTPTVTSGTLDGDNLTYTAVTGTIVEKFVIYRHNAGANTTWPVVVFEDTSVTGLPVTPNGGDITVTWNASGIFTISDVRMKTNIKEIGKIGAVPLYRFSYLGSNKLTIGFIAQEVEQVLPDAVAEKDGYKYVCYGKVIEAANGPIAQS